MMCIGFNRNKTSRKKTASLMMVMLWVWGLLASSPAFAAPQGGVVTSGSATINQAGNVTNINQSTNAAAINWQSFSVKPAETVNFNQPSSSSLTLNRVIGNERSIIEGAINATGKVFLLNSNGVLFTKDSSVNTAGFIASTLNITDEDFNTGNYVFKANGSTGSVINLGTITARDGGYVALLGNSVSNQGIITATKGTVAMASGDKVTLNFNGDSLLSVTVDEGALNALVENKEAIYADGGRVIMTAKAADDLLSAQVNTSGIIQARTLDDLKGDIKLLADNGATTVDGILDASAPTSGDGGFIETSGNKVKVNDTAVITTKSATGKNGMWLIDPDGYTIGLTTADGDMTATTLNNSLVNGNVTIASTSGSGSDGDINVNSAVSWSANTLTLNATNNIYVNAVMTATDEASLVANYGSGTNTDETPMGLYTYQGATLGAFAGKINFSGTGTVTLGAMPYTVINDATGLAAIVSNGNYVLGSDISGLTGSIAGTFTGNLNGFGHLITSPSLTATGLFDTIGKDPVTNTQAIASNLGITGATVAADSGSGTIDAVGILANSNEGKIINSFSGGTLNNSNITNVGGLVGINSGLIAQSYFYGGKVYVMDVAGGLVGTNANDGVIIDSSTISTGASYCLINTAGATGITYVGGLVGINEEGASISRSSAAMVVKLTDTNSMTGLFAGKNAGAIDQSYSFRNTTSSTGYSVGPHLAGFVWDNTATGRITDAYTTSLNFTNAKQAPNAQWDAGFVYTNAGTIANAYATEYSAGTLNSARYGFAYENIGTGTIENAYWYADTASGGTPVTDTSTATSLSSTEAATFSSYTGFDTNIWAASKSGYPLLRNLPVYISTSSPTTYGATIYSTASLGLSARGLQGGGGNSSYIDSISNSSYTPFTITMDNGYVNAGSWDAPRILSSSAYTNVKGFVTVNPAPLTISDVVTNKTYDGNITALLTGAPVITGLAGDQTLNINYTGATFSDKNVGTDKTVTLTYTVSNGDNGGKVTNYTIPSTTTATITPKSTTLAVTGNDKVYDGTTSDTVAYTLSGMVTGDDLSLNYSAIFSDKNVGTDKTVTVYNLSLSGTDAGNYTLVSTPSLQTTADITQRSLTVTGYKTADGTTSVSASDLTILNVAPGDSITLSGAATLASSSSGYQAITGPGTLNVSDPNYTVVGVAGNVVVGTNNLVLDKVASGTADIVASGATTTITTSDKAVIDWLSFSIGSGETLTFVQPAATSIVLNRVTGSEASVIAGTLNANGRVFVLNSNGILFTAGSSVNVAGLVASALQMTNDNFNNSNYIFTVASGNGPVINKGDIVIVDGGFLAMASGSGVTQSGDISAPNGDVLLVSADQLTLTLNATDVGLANYAIEGLNGMTAIGGTVNVADSGLLETAGSTIDLADGFTPNTGAGGTWSLSLPTITIGSGITSSAFVTNNLGLRNLSLNALDGDINVNSAVNWSANTLTLNAARNIYVNNVMTGAGTAGLVADYGSGANSDGTSYGLYTANTGNGSFSGKIDFSGTGGVAINGTSYTVINDATGLAAIVSNGNYVLGSDMGLTGVMDWTPLTSLSGVTLNGFGHVIDKLTSAQGGLFGGTLTAGNISNLGVTNAAVTVPAATTSTGILAGYLAYGNLVNVFTSGTVDVTQSLTSPSVGGLVGQVGSTSGNSAIYNSYSTAHVVGGGASASGSYTGGLVGQIGGTSTIAGSWFSGDVKYRKLAAVGGLVGAAPDRTVTISNSYSTGNVTPLDASASAVGSNSPIGGFIGMNFATINNSYETGNVVANGSNSNVYTGGFVGENFGVITNAYSTGSVTSNVPGPAPTGGFVGYMYMGTATNVYASGSVTAVTGATTKGGLAGQFNTGTITNGYWDMTLSGMSTTVGNKGTGLSGDEAKNIASYAGFDSAIWASSANGHPILKSTPVYVSTASPITYGGAYQAGDFRYVGLQWGDTASRFTYDAAGYLSPYGFINAGIYSANNLLNSSYYSNILGSIAVLPKALTITGAEVADKTYDGTTAASITATGSISGGVLAGESVSIAGTGAYFSDKNAGEDKTVNLNYGFTYANGQPTNNYVVGNNATATINPKTINASYTVSDKTYDGTTTVPADSYSSSLTGVIGPDSVSVKYASGLFADKNAGTDKTVTFSGLTLSGTDSGNYVLESTTVQTTADISPLTVLLYGSKDVGGASTIDGSALYVKNAIEGDTVTVSGTATISSSSKGIQSITDLNGLTLSNPNYTLTGSTGTVAVGDVSLVPDQVVYGTADIVTSGTTTTITTSDKALIDWLRFTIPAGETVTFVQPASTSIVLNRVTGNEQSVIAGTLNANGRIFIINSNGILFTADSSVNVGALLASALNITNADFLNNHYVFIAAPGSGPVINEGDIVIIDGGFVALASNNGVTNSNKLTTHSGDVLLVSADQLTLTLNATDSGLTGYAIEGPNGTTTVGGTVDVTGGGLLETAGGTIALADGFTLDTGIGGTWSLSLPTITIGSGITDSAFVTNNLGLRNLSLNALNGDLTINDAVTWAADTTLSLTALNDINIDKSINASGDNAGLVMNYGGDYHILTKASYSGAIIGADGYPVAQTDPHDPANGGDGVYASINLTGSNAILKINGNTYTLIRSMSDLDALDGYDAATHTGTKTVASGYYALAGNLDASGTTYTDALISTLSGALTGLGHTITGLTWNITAGNVGLVGMAGSGAVVRDLGLVNVSIAEASTDTEYQHYIGSLVGYNQGTVENTYATGTFVSDRGTSRVNNQMGIGGLVGASSGLITYSYTNMNISGQTYIGGLVGMLFDGTVSYCHSTGSVSGSWAGGLVGKGSGTIINSYASGTEDSGTYLGGLVGYLTGGSITSSFATGVMTSGTNAGGLVGQTDVGTYIFNSYATKDMTSLGGDTAGGMGGLVGTNNGLIDHSWASGNITTVDTSGGLVAMNNGTIRDSYATGNVTGSSAAGGFGGLVGENFGRIENSWASGNVSNLADIHRGDQGNIPDGTGGLVGTNNEQATIINSWASGDVTIQGLWQANWGGVGGLVGSNGGSIAGSYATGSVVGYGYNMGGLVGGTFSAGPGYNGTVTNSTYHDVKTEAAALAAYQKATWENGIMGEGSQITGQTMQYQSGSSGSGAAGGGQEGYGSVSMDGHITYADSDSYGAHIKAISTDEGTTYELEDDSKDENK